MNAIEMIEAQQKGKENTPAWMVGEQLKDICRSDRHCAEIVAQDLAMASKFKTAILAMMEQFKKAVDGE